MILYKKIISLSFFVLLTGITHNALASQNSSLPKQEYLDVYDLCVTYEKEWNNLSFFEKIFPSKSDSSIGEIKVIMKDKHILFNYSPEQLQKIKTKLTTALAEIKLLTKKDSNYRTWVKLALKLSISGLASQYINYNNTMFNTSLMLLNVYYSVGLSITTCTILNDFIEKIF